MRRRARPRAGASARTRGPRAANARSAGALVCLAAALLQPACRRGDGSAGAGRDRPGESAAEAARESSSPSPQAAAAGPQGGAGEIEAIRRARAALASAGIPLYPGAEGLDSTEMEKNAQPFIALDFFSLDPPEKVAAFYDSTLQKLTVRRDTTLARGVVRYEFQAPSSGLEVKPWDPRGADSTAVLPRFDRRDALGVTSADLDVYGKLLANARTHVVVNVPRADSAVRPADLAARQAEVAAGGSTAMPFDLERTTHLFRPTDHGGVQIVTADDRGDAEQVRLIREHLRREADRFRRGDFGDPARIHGDEMPGLAELHAGSGRIDVRFEPMPGGARITYVTSDPALVQAIHTWFEAQTSDHGAHAHD